MRLFAALTACVLLAPATATAAEDFWTRPVPANAVFVPAKLTALPTVKPEVVTYITATDTDPVTPIWAPAKWHERCSSGVPTAAKIRFPRNLVIPDSPDNNPTVVLGPRNRVELNAVARCEPGGPLIAVLCEGGHAGADISAYYGTIRCGELTGSAPIRHAGKILLPAQRFLAHAGDGFRWPAKKAEWYFNNPGRYGGTVPQLVHGSLLALPRNVTAEQLRITTQPGRRLFQMAQDYGLYVVCNAQVDAYAIVVDQDVPQEFQQSFGYPFRAGFGSWFDDVNRIAAALEVVDSNGP